MVKIFKLDTRKYDPQRKDYARADDGETVEAVMSSSRLSEYVKTADGDVYFRPTFRPEHDRWTRQYDLDGRDGFFEIEL